MALRRCGPFENNDAPRNFFTIYPELRPFRDGPFEANNPESRVVAMMSYLLYREGRNENKDVENALVLLLQVLSRSISEGDTCKEELNCLANELKATLPLEPSRQPLEEDLSNGVPLKCIVMVLSIILTLIVLIVFLTSDKKLTVSATKSTLAPNEQTQIVVQASGEGLVYIWTAENGTVEPAGQTARSTITYIAPNFLGTDIVRVQVRDRGGNIVFGETKIEVVQNTSGSTLITSSPSPTHVPDPTATLTAVETAVTMASATPSATLPPCPYQADNDEDTIVQLIEAEAEAVVGEDMAVIQTIFAPDAVIWDRANAENEQTEAIVYYVTLFTYNTFDEATHFQIQPFGPGIGPAVAYFASGSRGSYLTGGELVNYNNPFPSDHWTLEKRSGCWVIVRFEFNAAQIVPFP